MKTPSTQQTLLGVLLVVWGVIGFQMLGPTSEPSRVPLVNVTGPASIQAMKQGKHLAISLNKTKKSNRQRRKRENGFAAPINIFELYRSEEQGAPSSEELQTEDMDQESIQAEAFEEDLGSDLARFRFLGYVQLDHATQEEQGIALVSTPDALHTVRTGETIEGRILIKDVSPEEVTIEDLSSHQEQQLQLRARGD